MKDSRYCSDVHARSLAHPDFLRSALLGINSGENIVFLLKPIIFWAWIRTVMPVRIKKVLDPRPNLPRLFHPYTVFFVIRSAAASVAWSVRSEVLA